MKNTIKLFLVLIFISSCTPKVDRKFDYNFSNPKAIIDLPRELNEISGLHWEKENKLWAINDEKGIAYALNVNNGKILDKIKFKKRGDFEGIAKVEETLYVLKSNGTLLAVENNKRTKKELFAKGYEFEGLCYLKNRNSLLLACKEHKKANKNKFVWVFEYDLVTQRLREAPYLKIEKKEIGRKFKPSGIAIHPDNSVYIISGVSSQLIKVNPISNEMKEVQLQEKNFPQLEGICFNKEGEMYLASERGALNRGKLYKF